MNIETYTRYSQEENEFLIKNYPLHGCKFCADKLNRSILSIRGRVQKLKLTVDNLSAVMLKNREKPNNLYNVNADLFITPTTHPLYIHLGYYGRMVMTQPPTKFRSCHA